MNDPTPDISPIEAICFWFEDGQERTARTTLRQGALTNLEADTRFGHCTAFVVHSASFDVLRALGKPFQDRGKKNPDVPLTRPLLKRAPSVPYVEAEYKQPGRVPGSIFKLLGHALDLGEQNFYFVGVQGAVFKDLRERTSETLLDETDVAVTFSTHGNLTGPGGSTTLAKLASRLADQAVPTQLYARFLGTSQETDIVRRLIMRATENDYPVLIRGESGTGKELVAGAIHRYSNRDPFKVLNCAAIPSELLESELFGYAKGSHSTARGDKTGIWEAAEYGTLFLDEIGDLSLQHQAKILRALQEHKIRRIGENLERPVHARVVTATNRDLAAMVKLGQFREDLFNRLRYFTITTPPLRDHPSDIRYLAQKLWLEILRRNHAPNGNNAVPLSKEFLDALQKYPWPNNVRELKSTLVRLYTTFKTENPTPEDLYLTLELGGQINRVPATGEQASASRPALHKARCLLHLEQADEVIRACEIAVHPFLGPAHPRDEDIEHASLGIQQRISELDSLCRKPLLFHEELVYEAVSGLLEKLQWFLDTLEEQPARSIEFWKDAVEPVMKLAHTKLFRQVEKLTEDN